MVIFCTISQRVPVSFVIVTTFRRLPLRVSAAIQAGDGGVPGNCGWPRPVPVPLRVKGDGVGAFTIVSTFPAVMQLPVSAREALHALPEWLSIEAFVSLIRERNSDSTTSEPKP
jgi:hypothetical protein